MGDVFDDVRNVDHRIAARDTETKVIEEQQLHQGLLLEVRSQKSEVIG